LIGFVSKQVLRIASEKSTQIIYNGEFNMLSLDIT